MVPFSLRLALVACAVAAGTLVAGAPAAVAATSGSDSREASTSSASVSRGVCTTSLDDPQGRAASFTVRMARREGSGGFGFTATLQEKSRGGSWTTLSGSASPAGLGSFQPAADGAGSMVRKINVRGLRMGSSYRLKVGFRWTTASGRQTVTRRSSSCTVKDLRPNLGVARSLGWIPGTSGGQVVYRARLRVSRVATLTDRTATLSVLQGDTVLGSATFETLTRGVTALVPGARCKAGSDITIRIEAGSTVEERTLDDNELTARCDSLPGTALTARRHRVVG
ncbi:MAG: hypothetical protein ITG02_05730 [Patulibacter sp.]|nr:hypothetical protein [Patulibacter sp.]